MDHTISIVNYRPVDTGKRVEAFIDILIDDWLTICDVTIVKKENGEKFAGFPSHFDEKNQRWYSYIRLRDKLSFFRFSDQIVEAYEEFLLLKAD